MNHKETRSVMLFYCYAHEDEAYRLELEKHLSTYKRQGYLETWSDLSIQPGSIWEHTLETKLTAARLIALLISPDFLYSDVCNRQMHQALALSKGWLAAGLVHSPHHFPAAAGS